jgi:MFS family permease
MEPTLPLYLRDRFGLDETTIGLLFCVIVIPNMFISVIVGWVSDRYGHKLVCGLFMLSMAVASPCLGLPYSIPIEIIALMAFGLSSAGSLTPLLPDMASFVTSRGGGIMTFSFVYYSQISNYKLN